MRRPIFLAATGLCALAVFTCAAYAAGNAASGQDLFSRCVACHTVVKGGPDGIGPDLFAIVGRKAATRPDFSYSPALKNSGIVWTPDKLDAWIASPAKLVPGNRMAFGGISDAKQRTDLVAYLATLK
jgi:cytochrome c